MPSSLWSPGKSSSDRQAIHFIFPACYSRTATTSTLYPSIRDCNCNRALHLSVFAFVAALYMSLQSGDTNSHERERERKSKSRSPSYAIPFRYYLVNSHRKFIHPLGYILVPSIRDYYAIVAYPERC